MFMCGQTGFPYVFRASPTDVCLNDRIIGPHDGQVIRLLLVFFPP
jgi:hypothetical protein